jgi:hypothetical protein
MKFFLLSTLLVISILVITFLNVSLSRANQIESFLKESLEKVEEDIFGTLYITALSTTMEPNETFLINQKFYQNEVNNETLNANISLFVYTEGSDPRAHIVVFVKNLNFKNKTSNLNDNSKVYARFVFKDKVLKNGINQTYIDTTLSPLTQIRDQVFAIDSDYLFNLNVFNLKSVELTLLHENVLYDIDVLSIENFTALEEILKTIRSINNIETLQAKLNVYDSVKIDEIYQANVQFPLINVIIEILVIFGIYFIYQRFNLWYKKHYT